VSHARGKGKNDARKNRRESEIGGSGPLPHKNRKGTRRKDAKMPSGQVTRMEEKKRSSRQTDTPPWEKKRRSGDGAMGISWKVKHGVQP